MQHNLRLVGSSDAEPQIQRNHGHGGTVVYMKELWYIWRNCVYRELITHFAQMSTAYRVSNPNSHIVQGATVLASC